MFFVFFIFNKFFYVIRYDVMVDIIIVMIFFVKNVVDISDLIYDSNFNDMKMR